LRSWGRPKGGEGGILHIVGAKMSVGGLLDLGYKVKPWRNTKDFVRSGGIRSYIRLGGGKYFWRYGNCVTPGAQPKRHSYVTISRGPMARKKASLLQLGHGVVRGQYGVQYAPSPSLSTTLP